MHVIFSIIELVGFLLPAIVFTLTRQIWTLWALLFTFWVMHKVGLNKKWKHLKNKQSMV
jgi:hypothetical protein